MAYPYRGSRRAPARPTFGPDQIPAGAAGSLTVATFRPDGTFAGTATLAGDVTASDSRGVTLAWVDRATWHGGTDRERSEVFTWGRVRGWRAFAAG